MKLGLEALIIANTDCSVAIVWIFCNVCRRKSPVAGEVTEVGFFWEKLTVSVL